MTDYEKFLPARSATLTLSFVTFAAIAIGACSAGEVGETDSTDDTYVPPAPPTEPLPPADTATQAAQNYGGAPAGYGADSPFFGAGNYTGVDKSDPCNTVWKWQSDAAPVGGNLVTGSQVVYQEQLWEITGEGVDANYAMETCAPPGESWCADEYAWEVVGECPGK